MRLLSVALLLLLSLGCAGRSRPLSQALSATCGARLPKKGTNNTFDLKQVTVKDATGTCNDGSPPEMYVRRATDPAHANDWVLAFQGGGFCDDYDTCMTRYCGIGPFNATRMSTRFNGPSTPGEGILSPRNDNAFAGWNAVMLHYCTSDVWVGGAEQPVEMRGLFRGFTLTFEGAEVVRSLLKRLDQGARSNDGSVELPRMTAAKNIVVVGESAGAVGAIQHLDQVANRYPEATVYGVLDGGSSPTIALFPPALRDRARQWFAANYRDTFKNTWKVELDKSCDESDPACAYTEQLVAGKELKASVVLRQDLLDPVVFNIFKDTGLKPAQYADVTAKTLEDYAEKRRDSSFFGTRCQSHIITTAPEYFTMEAQNGSAGPGVTMQQVVEDLVLRGKRRVIVEAPSETAKSCGGKNGGRLW